MSKTSNRRRQEWLAVRTVMWSRSLQVGLALCAALSVVAGPVDDPVINPDEPPCNVCRAE